jgi:SseB protein C-terminal domain/SseB protein N-terminal domain
MNPLEEALVTAATEPAARLTFYRLLLEATLVLIDDSPGPALAGAPRTLPAGAKLQVPSVEIEGVLHTPVFSSLEMLQAVLETERKYVSMLGRDLLELVRGTHLVLNPGSSHGKLFIPREIDEILSGSIFQGYAEQVIQQNTRVLLGQPEPGEYPHHLTDALSTFFRANPAVRAAYLAQCAWPDTQESAHTLIGVDTLADPDALMPAIMEVIQQVALEQDVVDLVLIDDSELSKYMLEQTQPFFTRLD